MTTFLEFEEVGLPAARSPSNRDEMARASSSRINVCGEDADNSSLGEAVDCSGVPWPEGHGICPWPAAALGGTRVVNFTAASARDLLRGRTVLVNGDSTSRRLMWSLCHFLAEDANASAPHRRSGEGCCGTHRADIHCDIPSVLADDIMIEYKPSLLWDDSVDWLEKGGLTKAHDLRNESGLPGMGNNSILPEDMPRTKRPRSVHVFHPLAATWHQCAVPHEDRSGLNWTEPTCGLNRGAGAEPRDVRGTARRLVGGFCPRFDAAAAGLFDVTGKNDRPPLHIHGLTNLLAYRGGVQQSDRFNGLMLAVAQAAGSQQRKLCNLTSCGFFDQTTWMSTNASSMDVRLDCMPSDGWRNIHIYNEYGQLMRVQLLLNTILKTEREWEVGETKKRWRMCSQDEG